MDDFTDKEKRLITAILAIHEAIDEIDGVTNDQEERDAIRHLTIASNKCFDRLSFEAKNAVIEFYTRQSQNLE